MDVREKLVELLLAAQDEAEETCAGVACKECPATGANCGEELEVDYLIAHGVTLRDVPDRNVGKWIPVSERMPDLKPCDAGTAYSEAVNVLTSGRKVITAIWDGADFIGDAEFWGAEDEEVTHWTPVPLPLPQLPKIASENGEAKMEENG